MNAADKKHQAKRLKKAANRAVLDAAITRSRTQMMVAANLIEAASFARRIAGIVPPRENDGWAIEKHIKLEQITTDGGGA